MLLSILMGTLGAVSAPAIPDEPLLRPWTVQCTGDRSKCWMEFVLPTEPDGYQRGGIAVAYDAKKRQAMYVTVFVAADADRSAGVAIHFIDTVPSGPSYAPRPSGPGMMRLPIIDCGVQYCSARVNVAIDNGDGTTTDLFKELQERSLMWVLYVREGKPERFFIPVSGFPEALAAVARQPQPPPPEPSSSR